MKNAIDQNNFGSPPFTALMEWLKPRHWFSAHHHCRFDAMIPHENNETTRFIALDKCELNREYFYFMNIGNEVERYENGSAKLQLKYDPEWLAILRATNYLCNYIEMETILPRQTLNASHQNIQDIERIFNNNLEIPENFQRTSFFHDSRSPIDYMEMQMPQSGQINPQTSVLCKKLNILDPYEMALNYNL